MKVIVEGSPFENRHQLGIWRYLFEVLGRIAGRAEVQLRIGDSPIQPVPSGVAWFRDRSCLLATRRQLLRRAKRSIGQLHLPSALRGADVYHPTFYSPVWKNGPPTVLSVYDMTVETQYAICGPWAKVDIARKREAIRAAARCMCISQTTADELIRFYPEAAGKVRVIPLAVDPVEQVKESTERREAVLFVGQRNEYKNFAVILRAMTKHLWPKGITLRVAGNPAEPEDRDYIRSLGIEGRIEFLGRISEDSLAAEYRTARGILFPSLQEGFGLPILEAQKFGCPVACSDIPVFREVAGDGAFFFDPASPSSVAEAVAHLREPGVGVALAAKGFENIGRFSWDKAAEQTLVVYAEVSGERGR